MSSSNEKVPMKHVIAYIRPERLNAVKKALFADGIGKISVLSALGCGEEPKYFENYRGVDAEVDLKKRIRVEIVITEPFLQKCVSAIIRGAQTGAVGDGKIFITPVEDCVRIRTGERGVAAVG